jgi:hypothetical protein
VLAALRDEQHQRRRGRRIQTAPLNYGNELGGRSIPFSAVCVDLPVVATRPGERTLKGVRVVAWLITVPE